ncbi:MAG: TRAP transporter small permease subunit [Pseudomonadota bacterium]
MPVTEPHGDSYSAHPDRPVVERVPARWLFTAVGHLAGAALLAMVAAQGTVVLLRAVFGISLPAVQDLAVYLHAAAILLGLSVALIRDAHVRIAVRSVQSHKTDLIGSLFLTVPFGVLLAILALPYAQRSWLVGEGSADPDGLGGVYVIKALIVVGSVLLVVAGIAKAIANGRALTPRR